MRKLLIALTAMTLAWGNFAPIQAQQAQYPAPSGFRPIDPANPTGTVAPPQMVPINPSTQSGIYPTQSATGTSFDPYGSGGSMYAMPPAGATTFPPSSPYGYGTATMPPGSYYANPSYTGVPPPIPGAGQSAVMGTFPSTPSVYGQPGVYPYGTPSALYPGAPPSAMQSGIYPPGMPPSPYYGWNPQGSLFSSPTGSSTEFVRLFQGPRFRHAYIYGDGDPDALAINDSDVSVALVFPKFLHSTQPLYILPSFSLHQWSGPKPPSTADLPAMAYSAFVDMGWQSDSSLIWGAELGLRVGMFTDFDTSTSDSLRVLGRAIGRVRLTPCATLKGGIIYLDRNKTEMLPAFGVLWQASPNARLDLFYPEPKISHYMTTFGNKDAWWYVGGYYGGGAWTISRSNGTSDSIDINDLRVVVGLEFGSNEHLREGRRNGFIEIGYVFDRELLYKASPWDNLDLQDTFMIRAGIGY